MKDKLLQIINHYGIEHQQRKLEEEVFELQQAITLFDWHDEIANEQKAIEYIKEELADVNVLLEQIRYYYGIPYEEMEKVMNYKIDRQLERMQDENK